MAGDLIPPPSPAGRPPPDQPSEPQATEHLEQATRLTAAAAEPAVRQPAPFRGRFGFVFGALVGIAVCAAALAVVLVAAPDDTGPKLAENWSRWQPSTTDMVDGASDIAAHVALQYRLDGGDQLVQVRSSALEFQGTPLGVAVRPKGGELRFLEGDGLLYVLNGLAPSGALPGKASARRGQLLLREALELALYSFRYLDDVTMVAVLLPPSTNQPGSQSSNGAAGQTRAVFFRPGDLLSRLQVPLSQTLPAEPPRPSKLTAAEGRRIDDLTLRNLFLASVQPLKADQSYLVLVEPDRVT
ncbi:MAG TPA: hypothetical protein VHJ39_17505 [Solirubrobacteraceae bacterium]|jgi:hypothetical protein|nr:hypothetical protein [Solirubrobacteraceae bacterium]